MAHGLPRSEVQDPEKAKAPAGNRSPRRKANHLKEWPLRWNQL